MIFLELTNDYDPKIFAGYILFGIIILVMGYYIWQAQNEFNKRMDKRDRMNEEHTRRLQDKDLLTGQDFINGCERPTVMDNVN